MAANRGARPQSAQGSGRAQNDPVKHVIVLMLENRSFDQMLGALQKVYLDLDGTETAGPPRINMDPQGKRVAQMGRADRKMKGDPKHELPNALRQLSEAERQKRRGGSLSTRATAASAGRAAPTARRSPSRNCTTPGPGEAERPRRRCSGGGGGYADFFRAAWPLGRMAACDCCGP